VRSFRAIPGAFLINRFLPPFFDDIMSPMPMSAGHQTAGEPVPAHRPFSPCRLNSTDCTGNCLMDNAAPPRVRRPFLSNKPVEPELLVDCCHLLPRPGRAMARREQDFVRVNGLVTFLELRHQCFIDMQTTGCIDNQQRRVRCCELRQRVRQSCYGCPVIAVPIS